MSTATRPEERRRSPAERLVEPIGRLTLLGMADVAVDVRRDGGRRVAQLLLDDLGVRAGRQQGARRGVPKGVQGDPAEAGSSARTSKRPQHGAGLERCTDPGGEDQPAGTRRRLAPVTFSGAAGVTVLAQAHRRCRTRGARLVLRCAGRRRVLRSRQLTGLAVARRHCRGGVRATQRRPASATAAGPARWQHRSRGRRPRRRTGSAGSRSTCPPPPRPAGRPRRGRRAGGPGRTGSAASAAWNRSMSSQIRCSELLSTIHLPLILTVPGGACAPPGTAPVSRCMLGLPIVGNGGGEVGQAGEGR